MYEVHAGKEEEEDQEKIDPGKVYKTEEREEPDEIAMQMEGNSATQSNHSGEISYEDISIRGSRKREVSMRREIKQFTP